jgi:hypothetical protein
MNRIHIPVLVLLAACAQAPASQSQPLTSAQQIAAAVAPAPADLQAGATVLGFDAGGKLTTLRQGTNGLICIADEPGDDRFHVACYHQAMDPFMARGRALKAEGKTRDEIATMRAQEIEAGTIKMPGQPAMLYQYFGQKDSFDPATSTVQNVRRLTVIYMPYATPETTGLPTSAPAGSPWLMDAGKPWAHIMLSEPEKK